MIKIKIEVCSRMFTGVPSQVSYLILVETDKEKYAIPMYFRFRRNWDWGEGGIFYFDHMFDCYNREEYEKEGYKFYETESGIAGCRAYRDIIAYDGIHRDIIEKYAKFLAEGIRKYGNVEEAIAYADGAAAQYFYSLGLCMDE